jgi:hypothetical protein
MFLTSIAPCVPFIFLLHGGNYKVWFWCCCIADQPANLRADTTEVIFDVQKLRLKGRRGLLHFEDEAAVHGKPLKRMR